MHAQLSTPEQTAQWLRERVLGELVIDSRRVRPGDGFIAWSGRVTDARQHVDAAMHAGAAACVVEHAGLEAYENAGWMRSLSLPVASYRGLKQDVGLIADAYFGHPSAALTVVAVTGTNGKSSVAWWSAQALTALGRRCGVIGTLGVGEPGGTVSTGLTTPDPVTLHASLRRFVDAGLAACALEASSIGLAERRLDGLRATVAVFTNFSQDHLDYHGSLQAYWQCKRRLFAWDGLQAAVVHLDASGRGAELAAELRTRTDGPRVWTTAVDAEADLSASALRARADGLRFELSEGGRRVPVALPLIGSYNVANVLGVVGVLRALGYGLDEALDACASLGSVPGRLQRVSGPPGVPEVVVDYAHTPDALAQVLAALRPWAQARSGRLWCVFGCGGDRDATKRPRMGEVADRDADELVLTSDNPRSEDPLAILAQIRAGVQRADAVVLPERAEAIAHAVASAAPADVVLVAGKGHETTQEVAGRLLPFSDVEVAQAALQRRAAGGATA